MTLQSVKSEKKIGFGTVKPSNSNSRISIGQHEKMSGEREEEQETVHTLSYGGSDKKSEKKTIERREMTDYGLVRRL